ncbi:MAG: glycosyltransferase family 4 protein [Chlorobium sp.]|nr:MAG: glycosyltransferase family 4 protein [Chlorobium sp.]
MTSRDVLPRVLVVALGRINAQDSYNNGLLLRNLFGSWPRDKIAQIYSSADNGDKGYFSSYYRIGACDRRFGSFFYNFKINQENLLKNDITYSNKQFFDIGIRRKIKNIVKLLFIDTGIYELIFCPKISKKMISWIENYNPDIILAQGYNLTFTLLPLLLKQKIGVKLSFFATDDWPTYLYSGQLGEPIIFRWLMRPIVKNIVNRLFSEVDAPFAFCQPMADEYALRYGKKFIVLNHLDSPLRFKKAEPHRIYSHEVITIIVIGNYNRYRWPLLLDVNDACHELHTQGMNIRIVVLSSSIEPEGITALSLAPYIDLFPDPGNDLLPSYLKGADILLLAEGFDSRFVSAIKLSVSSKAHLFMFSQRPIIVYSHPETGVARYARAMGWAKLVTNRNTNELIEAIRCIVENKEKSKSLIEKAYEVGLKCHTSDVNAQRLIEGLSFSKAYREYSG